MAYAKSEATQAKLLESTARLIRTQGFAATGLKEIIDDSGVPRGSLYHHFPGGKEELVAKAVQFSGGGIIGKLELLLERTGHPVAAMRGFCDYYVEQLLGSDYRKGCPLATVSLEAAADVDAVHDAAAGAFEDIITLLARSLQTQGLSAGAAREHAVMVVSATEGAILLAKALRDTTPLIVVRDQLTKQLETALGGTS